LKWTSDQYERLGELGFFDGKRVELVCGHIYTFMTVNSPHSIAVQLCDEALRAILSAGYRVRIQQPLDLGRRSHPEPDLALVQAGIRDFCDSDPTTASLVIEVSETTLGYDRVVKAHAYALAGITDYWILNLVDRQLEVHRNPRPDPVRHRRFGYGDVTALPAKQSVVPLQFPQAVIKVAYMLP
jgi:hypothetical protein